MRASLGGASSKFPLPALHPRKGAAEKSLPRIGTRDNNPFRNLLKTPPTETSVYDTASEPAERKYPSSTWEEGWAGNTISKELRHPPRLGRGGRPATATLAKEDEGAESWDSAHHQLGQDVSTRRSGKVTMCWRCTPKTTLPPKKTKKYSGLWQASKLFHPLCLPPAPSHRRTTTAPDSGPSKDSAPTSSGPRDQHQVPQIGIPRYSRRCSIIISKRHHPSRLPRYLHLAISQDGHFLPIQDRAASNPAASGAPTPSGLHLDSRPAHLGPLGGGICDALIHAAHPRRRKSPSVF